MDKNVKMNLSTGILHVGGEVTAPMGKPDNIPIYLTTAYAVKDTHDYEDADRGGKYFYQRSANPNRDGLAELISYMENGEETLCTAAGMSAITATLLGLCNAGDHILCNAKIYSEVVEIAEGLLQDIGIEFTQVDFTDPEAVEANIKPNTKMLYTEIISNPLTYVCDIDKITAIAKKHGILTVVDSTFTTPFVIKPLDHGADVVIHSLTKYFGGHADISAGSVTSSKEIIAKMRHRYLMMGGCVDPFIAWLCARSIKTMGMRVTKQNENANKIAEALSKNPLVEKVYHPSRPDHPQYEVAQRLFSNGMNGAIVSFVAKGGTRDKVDDFMHRLNLVEYQGTLGGIGTTVTHPRTACIVEFTAEAMDRMGLVEGLIRISVGAEDAVDIIADIEQALEAFR